MEWVDLKRKVWHKSFHEIVQSIENAANFGTILMCGDGLERQIFPRVLIISADFEEQYIIQFAN